MDHKKVCSTIKFDMIQKENEELKKEVETLKKKLTVLQNEYMVESLTLECLTKIKAHACNNNQHTESNPCQESIVTMSKLLMDSLKDTKAKKEKIAALKTGVKQLRASEERAWITVSELQLELQKAQDALGNAKMNSFINEKEAKTSEQIVIVSETCKNCSKPQQEAEQNQPVTLLTPPSFTKLPVPVKSELIDSSPLSVVLTNGALHPNGTQDKDGYSSDSDYGRGARQMFTPPLNNRSFVKMHRSAEDTNNRSFVKMHRSAEDTNNNGISTSPIKPVYSNHTNPSLVKFDQNFMLPERKNTIWIHERNMPKMFGEYSSVVRRTVNESGNWMKSNGDTNNNGVNTSPIIPGYPNHTNPSQMKFDQKFMPLERKNTTWKHERNMPKMFSEFSSVVRRSVNDKNPIMVLKELSEKQFWPQPIFTLVQEYGPPHMRKFIYKVNVNGTEYKSSPGLTKQSAKAKAAETSLKCLLD